MQKTQLLLSLMHDLIGTKGLYDGNVYTLIEVIYEDQKIVLQAENESPSIQDSFLGEAKRYAQTYYTVPIFSSVKKTIHPVLQEFFGPDINNVLSEHMEPQ